MATWLAGWPSLLAAWMCLSGGCSQVAALPALAVDYIDVSVLALGLCRPVEMEGARRLAGNPRWLYLADCELGGDVKKIKMTSACIQRNSH